MSRVSRVSRANDPAFPLPVLPEDTLGYSLGGLTQLQLVGTLLLQGLLASGKGGTMENKILCAADTAEAFLEELDERASRAITRGAERK